MNVSSRMPLFYKHEAKFVEGIGIEFFQTLVKGIHNGFCGSGSSNKDYNVATYTKSCFPMSVNGTKQSKPEEAKANAWRGALTPAWAAEGINAAYRNAARLLGDAEKLFVAGSFPSSLSLAVLAIE